MKRKEIEVREKDWKGACGERERERGKLKCKNKCLALKERGIYVTKWKKKCIVRKSNKGRV